MLVGVYVDALALANAELLLEQGGRADLAGETLVLRDNVSFLQNL